MAVTMIGIDEMVKEAGREVGLRRNVYRRRVEQGLMTQALADRQIAVMEKIYQTLKLLQMKDDDE